MSENVPVEVTTKFVTSVDDLPAAWAFVMGKVDQVGPNPRITISPFWAFSPLDPDPEPSPPRRFEVSVSGMVHESPERAA